MIWRKIKRFIFNLDWFSIVKKTIGKYSKIDSKILWKSVSLFFLGLFVGVIFYIVFSLYTSFIGLSVFNDMAICVSKYHTWDCKSSYDYTNSSFYPIVIIHLLISIFIGYISTKSIPNKKILIFYYLPIVLIYLYVFLHGYFSSV